MNNEIIQPFSSSAQPLQIGIYEHYKGNLYKLLYIAHHSETLEELVVYQALYGSHDIWVRPISMFMEEIEFKNQKMSRFKFIE
jgi:hypothetical protein